MIIPLQIKKMYQYSSTGYEKRSLQKENQIMQKSKNHFRISKSITTQNCRYRDLTIQDKDRVFDFISKFVTRSRTEFEPKLESCNIVIFYNYNRTKIKGLWCFETLAQFFREKEINIFHTRLVLIRPTKYKAQIYTQILMQIIFPLFFQSMAKPMYGLITAATFMSLIFLDNWAPVYWPSIKGETPPDIEKIKNQVLLEICGSDWNPETNVIYGKNRWQWKGSLSADANPSDPLIKFFHLKTPGNHEGNYSPYIFPINIRFFLHCFTQLLKIYWRKIQNINISWTLSRLRLNRYYRAEK
tara:strand:+ start:324 stop:1220 length:897 start_codon:yes stop_codon:yes gene_type:complete